MVALKDCGRATKQRLPVHQCALHGRCLPNFRPTDEQREKWGPGQPIESDVQLFKWCATCPDRTPLAAPGG